MPAWNLGELMSATTTALRDPPALLTSTVSFWVNQAYSDVWMALKHDEQEVFATRKLAIDASTTTWPEDFGSLIGAPSNLSYNNEMWIEVNTDQLDSLATTSGVPRYFSSARTVLVFRPWSDSTYDITFRYRRTMSDMTVTTAVPSIKTHYRPAIYHRAAQLLADNVVLDPVAGQRAATQFDQFVRQVPNDTALRHRDKHALGLSLSRRGAVSRRGSGYSFDASSF